MGGEIGGTEGRPPIFGEAVLSEKCESTNRKKRNFFDVKQTLIV